MPGPKIVAHRGNAAAFPENSLPALAAAVDCGVRFVEFDVQLTADGVPVMVHDPDLARVGTVNRSVLESCFADLKDCSIGEPARFGETFTEVRLSTLKQVMDWLQEYPDVTAFVEIKTESIDRFGVNDVMRVLQPIIGAVWQQCILISYSQELCWQARANGFRRIGWVLAQYDIASQAAAEALRPDYLICNWQRLPPAPARPWDGPWQWMAYEVADREQLAALLDRGIDLIESMNPCVLQQALSEDGHAPV